MKPALFRASTCAAVLSLLAACGGGGGDDESGPVGGPPLPTPSAAFAVSSSSVNEGAGVAVQVTLSSAAPGNVIIPFTITGTASSGADYTIAVSPLTIPYGSSSGSIFVSATDDVGDEPDESLTIAMGTPTHATLGVATNSTVTIIDMDVPTVQGRVANSASGTGIEGVTASVGSISDTTDANGQYVVAGFPSALSVVVSFDADGFAPQSRVVDYVSMANAPLSLPMVPVALEQSFPPADPIVISVPNSTAQVTITGNTLRTASDVAPTGQVTAEITPLLAASNVDVLPGNYLGANGGGLGQPMETYGALDVRITDANGAALQLASATTATIRIPLSSRSEMPPSPLPLFYYDRVAGVWQQQGTATLQGTGSNRYYEGTISQFGTWTVSTLYTTVDVTGCVQDAAGQRIVDAVVTIEGTTYASKLRTVTDASGNFTLRAKPNSSAFLQATKGDAISNSPDVATQSANVNLATCLVLSNTNLSIKLTWGDLPRDLDSHTLGANADEHVDYTSLGSLTAAPYIELDVDDVTGLGPEITTFSRVARNRRYSFYVHNYSQTFGPGQTDSPARVEITSGGTQRVFTPPAGETNQTMYWHVFDIVTNNNCVVSIVPVQQFRIAEPTNPNVGNDATYCASGL